MVKEARGKVSKQWSCYWCGDLKSKHDDKCACDSDSGKYVSTLEVNTRMSKAAIKWGVKDLTSLEEFIDADKEELRQKGIRNFGATSQFEFFQIYRELKDRM